MPVMHDLSVAVREGEGRLGLQVEFTTPYTHEDAHWQGGLRSRLTLCTSQE
jgi:hypothetical protein